MDEKGFLLGIGLEVKRICRRGRKSHRFKEEGNRESCTLIETVSAAGRVLTPVIIWKAKQHIAGWYKEEKEENYWYGFQENGYNDSYIEQEYLEKVFEPETTDR